MWKIEKQWRGIPASRQRATQVTYKTFREVEKVVEELRHEMPSREFFIVPIKEKETEE